MTLGLFRVRLDDGSIRLARGDVTVGPQRLLGAALRLDDLLAAGDGLERALSTDGGDVPVGAKLLAPIESQEVWAAGVTYERSRAARAEEASDPGPYDLVYEAERPELFFKAAGWRVRGPREPIGVRSDSEWNVPEPELALAVSSDLAVVGFTIGNDVSSRAIEGQNPLYLPQAKIYDGACALGPCIVPVSQADPPFDVRLEIVRDGATLVSALTSTALIRRGFEDLTRWLGSALSLPVGAFLLTGTGIVPEPEITLRPGDVVRIAIGPLGLLENRVDAVGAGRSKATASAREAG